MSSGKRVIRQRQEDVAVPQQAPSNSAAAAAGKKQKEQQQQVVADDDFEQQQNPQAAPAEAETAKILLHQLSYDVEEIYRDTIQRLCGGPAATVQLTSKATAAASAAGKDDAKSQQQQQQKSDPVHFFVDDNESATMLIRFPDKASAKRLASRLHNAQLFGHQVQARCVPSETLEPSYNPCGVKITETWSPVIAQQQQQKQTARKDDAAGGAAVNIKFTLHQLQQYLAASNPGFLGVTEITQQQQQQEKGSAAAAPRRVFIATYADSGAALQARALMSGRAFHGSHLLFERVKMSELTNEDED
jgi:hypothetical protein